MNKEALKKFNPTEAKLKALKVEYSALVIEDIYDLKGYNAVDNARKDLKRHRVDIQKFGKGLREEAIARQKAILAEEKKLVALIEPLELELKQKQDEIDHAKEIERRKKKLPERKERLEAIEVTDSIDQALLEMDDATFDEFYNEEHAKHLEQKEAEAERKREEEKAKLDAEKAELEAGKTKLAEEKAQIEQDKKDGIQRKKDAAEAEKVEKKRKAQEKIDREEAVEKAKLETEERIARGAEEKKAVEAKEQARLEKKKKYMDFLNKHGVNDDAPEGTFLVRNEEDSVVIYKKVASMKI